MSFEITTAFVQQFGTNVHLKAQQNGSRLKHSVSMLPNVVGKEFFEDQISATAARKKTTRHGDTPLIQTPHAKRKGIMYDFEWADLIDQLDKVKTLNDPTSKYVINAGNAMGRSMDDEIITAANATAYTGEDGTTQVALPSTQKIVHGSAGLTLAKLNEAREIFEGNDIDPDEPKYMLVSSKQVTNLLDTTEIKSSDYNSVKALVEGRINTFLGFDFIRTERLNIDGNSDRLVLAYAQSGIMLGIGQDVQFRITERSDKSYSVQPYFSMSIGATRMEEEKVVEIACNE